MLAKAVNQNALDLPLTAEEAEAGGLSEDRRRSESGSVYKGSERGGYKDEPGSRLDAGVLRDPFDLKAIINSGFGKYFSNEYGYDQQMMMFHPVGGMDAIIKAFEKRIGNRIKYRAEVKEIRQSSSGVRIVYTDGHSAREQEIRGDYCICTIPLTVLKKIPADFSPEMSKAISASVTPLQVKSACSSNGVLGRRRIFIWRALTNMDITQIYYPPTDYFGKKGILLGYYAYGALPINSEPCRMPSALR